MKVKKPPPIQTKPFCSFSIYSCNNCSYHCWVDCCCLFSSLENSVSYSNKPAPHFTALYSLFPSSLPFNFSYNSLSLLHILVFVVPVMEIFTYSSNVQIKTKLFSREINKYFHSVETPSMITGKHMIRVWWTRSG